MVKDENSGAFVALYWFFALAFSITIPVQIWAWMNSSGGKIDNWCVIIGSIGSLASGAGSIGLLVFAIRQLPAEISKWRSQRTYEKRLELALDFVLLQHDILSKTTITISDFLRPEERHLRFYTELNTLRVNLAQITYSSLIMFKARFDLLFKVGDFDLARRTAEDLEKLSEVYLSISRKFSHAVMLSPSPVLHARNFSTQMKKTFSYTSHPTKIVTPELVEVENLTLAIHENLKAFVHDF